MNQDLYQALKARVTGEVRFDRASRLMYSTDASIYEIEPIGVVIPRNREDVFATMEIARDFKVPVLPRGAGTSLAGQTVGDAVVMDMSKHLNRVLEVNSEERWAIVEPGVVQEQLNLHLRPMGFLFGPDTSTANRATIGGMMGNNSAGSHSIVYGKTIDHILEMDVVLSSGEGRTLREMKCEEAAARGGLEARIAEIVRHNRDEIERRYPKIMRRVSGYNLDEFVRNGKFNLVKLVVGSEGTLAAVHQAKVRIEPRPPATALCVVHFADIVGSIRASDIILPFKPAAIELIDDMIIELGRNSLEISRLMGFVQGNPTAVLIVEFYGANEADLRSKLDEMEAALKRNRAGYAYVRAFDQIEQTNIWKVRKAGLGLLLGMKGERKPIAFVEDCAVEPAKLPEFFVKFRDVIQKYKTSAGYYGHASVGCLHIRPLINTKEGTMCPSYMVNLEDKHSTRGRANLMREILSGKLPPEEFTGKDLYETLDLCLECKGCKAECPSNVDMAKLKYEFLAHYNEVNGTPLRARMFANIHAMSKLASIWPAMANWTLKNPVMRRVLDKFVGIDARRKLP